MAKEKEVKKQEKPDEKQEKTEKNQNIISIKHGRVVTDA